MDSRVSQYGITEGIRRFVTNANHRIYSQSSVSFCCSYDTYTPTRNYLFHDYGVQRNGHGNNEWFRRQKQRFRLEAIRRAKKVLNSLDEDLPEGNLANLGLYGLGNRRSLEQLQQFTNINLKAKTDNVGPNMICMHNDFVAYDKSISPVANLYDEPVNLDAQPDYPLRTNLKFPPNTQPDNKHDSLLEQTVSLGGLPHHVVVQPSPLARLPSASLLFILWIFGLVIWCLLFLQNPPAADYTRAQKPRKVRPAKMRVHKDV